MLRVTARLDAAEAGEALGLLDEIAPQGSEGALFPVLVSLVVDPSNSEVRICKLNLTSTRI